MESSDMKYKSALVVIAVHGLHGTANDWKYFEHALEEHFPQFIHKSELMFHLVSKKNEMFRTHEGLETMGRRLADEVYAFLKNEVIPKLRERLKNDAQCRWHVQFTVVGHSLGGLIIRMALPQILNAIPILGADVKLDGEGMEAASCTLQTPLKSDTDVVHEKIIDIAMEEEHEAEEDDDRFKIIFKPCSYISISTPHLGSRRPRPISATDGISDPWNTIIAHGSLLYCSTAAGKTGRELVLVDAKDDINSAQLMELSTPGGKYMKALNMFQYKTIIGHSQDFTVPAASALIAPHVKQSKEGLEEERFAITGAAGLSPDFKQSFSLAVRKAFNNEIGLRRNSSYFDDRVFDKVDTPQLFPMTTRRLTGSNGPTNFDIDVDADISNKTTGQPSELKSSPDSLWEAGVDVEYNVQMLSYLNTIEWRRILLDYNFNSIWRYTIHAVVIGKDMPLIPSSLRHLGRRSADFIIRILMVDYITTRKYADLESTETLQQE